MNTETQVLQQLIGILEKRPEIRNRYLSEIQRFKDNKRTNDNDKFRLGVIGVTSSGKSTMINSLLGESLLPDDVRPSSSQLVTCYKGSQRCATVFFENSTARTYFGKQLTASLISQYGNELINSRNKEHVKQIEVRTPNFPFEDNLVLIDSPGLDAFGFEGHEQLTMHSLLPTIDFALFITTCKTNSDEKMRNVLNVIADYDKPVIIIQNMIDSLRSSPDEKKSVEDVALDHKHRIERIVKESKIRDKSKVYIIQISAKWALEAREEIQKGRNASKKLADSNYENLISSIKSVFSLVKPNVEINRVRILKKDIDKIIADAEIDSKGESLQSITFDLVGKKNELESKYDDCSSSINTEIDKLSDKQDEIRNSNLDQSALDRIIAFTRGIESTIISKMRSYYKEIEKDCESLNVDVRNYTMAFQTTDLGSLNVQKETYTTTEKVFDGYDYVDSDSFGSGVKRFFGEIFGQKEWGRKKVEKYRYVSKNHTRTDYCGTRKRAINYLNGAESAYKRTLSTWGKTIDRINEELYKVIDRREQEFENRKKLALKAEVYKELAKELKILSTSINLQTSQSEIVHTDNQIGIHSRYTDISVSKQAYNIARLAQSYSAAMQQTVIKAISESSNKTIIVGWDKFSEAEWLKRCFSLSLDYNSISDGINNYKSIVIVNKPSSVTLGSAKSSTPSNIYVLVNATQYGAALKQIASLGLNKLLNRSDRLFFVIQDFSEIIIARAVDETLRNMKSLGQEIGYGMDYRILLNHDNPVYNMAAAEVQVNPCKLQSDEVRLLDKFQRNYAFLLKANTGISKNLQSIIKNLSSK